MSKRSKKLREGVSLPNTDIKWPTKGDCGFHCEACARRDDRIEELKRDKAILRKWLDTVEGNYDRLESKWDALPWEEIEMVIAEGGDPRTVGTLLRKIIALRE